MAIYGFKISNSVVQRRMKLLAKHIWKSMVSPLKWSLSTQKDNQTIKKTLIYQYILSLFWGIIKKNPDSSILQLPLRQSLSLHPLNLNQLCDLLQSVECSRIDLSVPSVGLQWICHFCSHPLGIIPWLREEAQASLLGDERPHWPVQ